MSTSVATNVGTVQRCNSGGKVPEDLKEKTKNKTLLDGFPSLIVLNSSHQVQMKLALNLEKSART